MNIVTKAPSIREIYKPKPLNKPLSFLITMLALGALVSLKLYLNLASTEAPLLSTITFSTTVGCMGAVVSNFFKQSQEPHYYELLKLPSSYEYKTHTSTAAGVIHAFGKTLLLPARYNLQLIACVIQPTPGENHEMSTWKKRAIQIGAFVGWLMTIPFAIVFGIFGSLITWSVHPFRPAISYMNNSQNHQNCKPALTKDNPLTIECLNTALMHKSVSTLDDLRDPLKRATEMAASYTDDAQGPNIVFFSETFNADASQVLLEGLKKTYPWIIHNVRPCISSFSSGLACASKYPIENARFHTFTSSMGSDSLAPKGVLRVMLQDMNGKPVLIYSTHLQAWSGNEQDAIRISQISEIESFMKDDLVLYKDAVQVVVGDLNTSLGDKAWNYLKAHFNNLSPEEEPKGTWYQRIPEWGTAKWESSPHPTTAQLDHVLVGPDSELTGRVKHRESNAKNTQSASSDHLGVWAALWRKK